MRFHSISGYSVSDTGIKMVVRKEFRVILPLTVEEPDETFGHLSEVGHLLEVGQRDVLDIATYQVGQLYSVAQASKNETGGGEGIEVLENSPYEEDNKTGQFTHKIYHLQNKVPRWIRALAPSGALEIHEKAWNAYPYCKTEVSNPGYMNDSFYIRIETWHKPGRGDIPNVHNLSAAELRKRDVVVIDIANDKVDPKDYKPEWDPTKFTSAKTQRGPLTGPWKSQCEPVMCAYKLVTCEFKWFGFQTYVEDFIMKTEKRLFLNFHRQVFCWIDEYIDLTMDDIRRIEDTTKEELNKQRTTGAIRGTIDNSDKKS